MNKLKLFFASKKLLMAQAVDLQRQLWEAWEDTEYWQKGYFAMRCSYENVATQLHRVARERDEERRQRRLADMRQADTIREMQSFIEDMLEALPNEEE